MKKLRNLVSLKVSLPQSSWIIWGKYSLVWISMTTSVKWLLISTLVPTLIEALISYVTMILFLRGPRGLLWEGRADKPEPPKWAPRLGVLPEAMFILFTCASSEPQFLVELISTKTCQMNVRAGKTLQSSRCRPTSHFLVNLGP